LRCFPLSRPTGVRAEGMESSVTLVRGVDDSVVMAVLFRSLVVCIVVCIFDEPHS